LIVSIPGNPEGVKGHLAVRYPPSGNERARSARTPRHVSSGFTGPVHTYFRVLPSNEMQTTEQTLCIIYT
jgi:hypothetical protein